MRVLTGIIDRPGSSPGLSTLKYLIFSLGWSESVILPRYCPPSGWEISIDETRGHREPIEDVGNEDKTLLHAKSSLFTGIVLIDSTAEMKHLTDTREDHRGFGHAGMPASCVSDRYNKKSSPSLPRLAIFNLGIPTPVPTYTIGSTPFFNVDLGRFGTPFVRHNASCVLDVLDIACQTWIA